MDRFSNRNDPIRLRFHYLNGLKCHHVHYNNKNKFFLKLKYNKK